MIDHISCTVFLRLTPPVSPNTRSKSGGVRMSKAAMLDLKPGQYSSMQLKTGENNTSIQSYT